jgi:hypothetical protein
MHPPDEGLLLPEGLLPARAFVRGLFQWDGFQLNFGRSRQLLFPILSICWRFLEKQTAGQVFLQRHSMPGC